MCHTVTSSIVACRAFEKQTDSFKYCVISSSPATKAEAKEAHKVIAIVLVVPIIFHPVPQDSTCYLLGRKRMYATDQPITGEAKISPANAMLA